MSDCLKRDRLRSLADVDFKHEKPMKCPSCGDEITASTGVNGATLPKPGDITVCFNCGHVAAYADDLTIRALNDAEMVEIAGNPLLVDMQRMIGIVRKNIRRAQP